MLQAANDNVLMDSFQKAAAYNNGETPLVMAYIGNDDPHRGDSKGAIGLARTVAEMMNGRHVYLDDEMLNRNFASLPDIKSKLRAYLNMNGCPDIVIGAASHVIKTVAKKTPGMTVQGVNEILTLMVKDKHYHDELVAHHLTRPLLAEKGAEFKQNFPWIEGPLVAVMMGGYLDTDKTNDLAERLVAIGKNYPKITFFLCPSLRTGKARQNLTDDLNELIDPSRTFFQKILRAKGVEKKLQYAFHALQKSGCAQKSTIKTISVISVDYGKAIRNYNPYLGLLANADHIVAAGHSFSLVSEALFTGKNIYTYNTGDDYTHLTEEGYITRLETLNPDAPFPTHAMPPIDITRQVAEVIVEDYKKNTGQYEPVPKPTAIATYTAAP